MKTFLQLYNECVTSDVVGPPADSATTDSQFSGDQIYAPEDARNPTRVMPMISRFGWVTPKKKPKRKKK